MNKMFKHEETIKELLYSYYFCMYDFFFKYVLTFILKYSLLMKIKNVLLYIIHYQPYVINENRYLNFVVYLNPYMI